MPRISGIDIPPKKKIKISLRYIYGIGPTNAMDIPKEAGTHHTTQDGIHALLLEHVALGKRVVRLKGGDPFIFGRGGEACEVLRGHQITFEVVHGVHAALACRASRCERCGRAWIAGAHLGERGEGARGLARRHADRVRRRPRASRA